MKYIIHTYGCQMNYSDSERIESFLDNLGYERASSDVSADLIVYNTCSIRQKAEDRIFGLMPKLAQLKKQNPGLLVMITGCMVRKSSTRLDEETKPDKLIRMLPEVDIVFKIDELMKLAEMMRKFEAKNLPQMDEELLDHYFKISPTYAQTPVNQAFIPVSMGCDKFCTYCIVPFTRGREKSRPIADIISEAEKVAEMGFKEITLVGQTVNSYGNSVYDKLHGNIGFIPEGKEPFPYLLEELDKLKKLGVERIRWTSPHPKDMSSALIDAMAKLETQMPCLHLPVQSGDNETLKRMNRPYSVERYKEIIAELREKIPGIAISTDIIVGFCGETEEEFNNTCEFFKEMDFEFAYLAQYSERKGTFASKRLKDDIPTEVKKKRWNILNDILRENSRNALAKYLGKTEKVLFERITNDAIYGKTETMKEVKIEMEKPDKSLLGQILPVEIINTREWELIGKILVDVDKFV
jgi:tRNA-2-methylthio-N6-dimethylallyladenosine synthase